jgi:hypothetical protein
MEDGGDSAEQPAINSAKVGNIFHMGPNYLMDGPASPVMRLIPKAPYDGLSP